ncbi:MAG: hypothetical protein K2M12_00465, partial [Muribaculaceae bacterium]|nr:hypothetical protein [Muribaculaceae bacterium]
PQALCESDAVRYVARRYGTTPEKIMEHYLQQAGIIQIDEGQPRDSFELAPNELALFCDLGVKPSIVVIQ